MKKTLFILSIIFAFGCAQSPYSSPALEHQSAQDRAAGVEFRIPNVAFSAGQTVEAKFSVAGFTDITAFQFAMNFDTSALAYSHTTFTGQIPDFNVECCFGMQWMGYFMEPGEVRVAWVKYSPGGVTLPDNTSVFSMFFTAKKAGNLGQYYPFWPDNFILPPEASDSQFNILPLTVIYQSLPAPPTGGGNAGNTKKKKKKHG